MPEGDFYGSEKSVTVPNATTVDIVHVDSHGNRTTLKEGLALQAGEIVDCAALSMDKLEAFLASEIDRVNDEGALFSLHMKATMMKVSDPILFGAAVRAFFKPVVDKHGDALTAAGVDFNNGFGDLVAKLPVHGRSRPRSHRSHHPRDPRSTS